jgi:hypothetical protein
MVTVKLTECDGPPTESDAVTLMLCEPVGVPGIEAVAAEDEPQPESEINPATAKSSNVFKRISPVQRR